MELRRRGKRVFEPETPPESGNSTAGQQLASYYASTNAHPPAPVSVPGLLHTRVDVSGRGGGGAEMRSGAGAWRRVDGRGRILRLVAAVVVGVAVPSIGLIPVATTRPSSRTMALRPTTMTMPHTYSPLIPGHLQQQSLQEDHRLRVGTLLATSAAGRRGSSGDAVEDEDEDPAAANIAVAVRHRRGNAAMSRNEAAVLLNTDLLPKTDAGRRHTVGRRAQKILPLVEKAGGSGERGCIAPPGTSAAVRGRDPRLAATYGEFPLESLDALLDAAEPWRLPTTSTTPAPREQTIVDLGSGCGRLCLYLALTRPSHHRVVGVELSPDLHHEAVHAVDRARSSGWFESVNAVDSIAPMDEAQTQTLLELYQGPADAHIGVLQRTDVVFAYCTTWDNDGFSPDVGGVVLSWEWRQLFARAFPRPGTIAVTTDRTLCDGCDDTVWKLLERLDVPNPEVGGSSTGYIHVRL